MEPQDLHNDLDTSLAQGKDRFAAIDDFQVRMEALAGQANPSLENRTAAMSLGVAVKGALLRSRTELGTLDFADYGRFQDTMVRLGLVVDGTDFQGMPVAMLTTKGLHQASLLKGYARDLHKGFAWQDYVRHAAPSARESEQKALWGETAFRGSLATDERVWSNGHMAMVWPDNDKYLPVKFRGNITAMPTRDFDRVWPQDMMVRERIEPVGVSGVLNASKRGFTDARQIWFSNGTTADGRYVDAILREYPDASFHANPKQAMRGSIAITAPHRDGERVVGVCMPTSSGYLANAMPEGVGRAMDAYWLTKGQDPRAKAVERAMQEKMRAFSETNGFFNTALRSGGGNNVVLTGMWNEFPTPHLALQWDVVSNQALRNLAKHTQVLVLGGSTPQEIERIKTTKPKDLVQRWKQETTLAEIGRDDLSMAMTDGLGRRTALDNIEKVEHYKRERALPEWLGSSVLHELRYKLEALDNQAFTPPRERDGPPVAIGKRVRWTANPPNMGNIEGLLTQCDRSQAGNWRVTIATRRYDGETINQRMWTNEGTVQEAGWSIDRDFRFTKLVEPNGEHRLVESANELEDIVHGIAIEDPAMAHYADALRTQFWQTRTLDEYIQSIDDALIKGYGVSVEEGLFSDGLEYQRDVGITPLAMAQVVGNRLGLTPLPPPPASPADDAPGLVHASGSMLAARPSISQAAKPEPFLHAGFSHS